MPNYTEIVWTGGMALLMGLLIGLERERNPAAKAGLRARRLDVVAQAERDYIAIHTAEHIITLYRDAFVPQAEASPAAALAAYRPPKVDFQTLVTAVIEVLDLRQQYFRAIADHEIALARLRQLIGEQP